VGVVPCQQAIPLLLATPHARQKQNPAALRASRTKCAQSVAGLSSQHRIQRLFAVQLIMLVVVDILSTVTAAVSHSICTGAH
jgi:hypothetical protein